MSKAKPKANRRKFLATLSLAAAGAAATWGKLLPEAFGMTPDGGGGGGVQPPTSENPIVSDLSASRTQELLQHAALSMDVAALLSLAPSSQPGAPIAAHQTICTDYTTEAVTIPYFAQDDSVAVYVLFGTLTFTTGDAAGYGIAQCVGAYPNETVYIAMQGQTYRATDADLESVLLGAFYAPSAPAPAPARFMKQQRPRWIRTMYADNCPFDIYTGMPRPGDPPNGPRLIPCNAACAGPCDSYPGHTATGLILVLVCIIGIVGATLVTVGSAGSGAAVAALAAAVICGFAWRQINDAMNAAHDCSVCLTNCYADNRAACQTWLQTNGGGG